MSDHKHTKNCETVGPLGSCWQCDQAELTRLRAELESAIMARDDNARSRAYCREQEEIQKTRAEKAEAEVAALKAERDSWKAAHDVCCRDKQESDDAVAALKAERDAALERVEHLEDKLENIVVGNHEGKAHEYAFKALGQTLTTKPEQEKP